MFWRRVSIVEFCLPICCYFGSLLAATCNFNVKMKQNLLNDGFHRNLTYGIVFNPAGERDEWLHKGCTVGLEQLLPRGIYANPDELEDLRRSSRLTAVLKNKVNVEMPAEDSEPSIVYLMGKMVDSKVYLWLPVHARYHRAKAGGGMVPNEIPPPKLYLRCPDQRLDTCDQPVSPVVTFLCNGSSRERCSWKDIPYTLMTKTLTWEMPVGNTDHYYVVAATTAVVIILGSLYLLKILHEYQLSQKKKQY